MRQPSAARSVLPIVQTLTRHLEALRHHHAAALENNQDTAEAIHKFRVTTRRLQAGLDLLQFGPNAAIARHLKQRLRDARNSLSRIRNYDVLTGMVQASWQGVSDDAAPDVTLLARRLNQERDREVAEALNALQQLKLKPIVSMLTEPSPGRKKKHRLDLQRLDEVKIKARAARRLERRLADFLAHVARLQDTSDPDRIHQLRIAAKRLRYLLEILADLGFREPKGSVRWLRTEQGKIGDWHDVFCLEEEVLNIVAKSEDRHGRLDESAALLRATAELVKARDAKASGTFPVKPPNYFERSIRRLLRDLGR